MPYQPTHCPVGPRDARYAWASRLVAQLRPRIKANDEWGYVEGLIDGVVVTSINQQAAISQAESLAELAGNGDLPPDAALPLAAFILKGMA